ncbi:bifunctional metallophosphatase/5'-nucleotidase [Bacteroides sp. OttesenSCG-928-D19]|nr:bifunctional metallophosphatase/5'-nucleotidase [Bacteroides sp. OttesenSCG-928-D19]
MKKAVLFCVTIFFYAYSFADSKDVKLKFIETSDIHAAFYPYDFIYKKSMPGSLARVHALAKEKRKEYKENLVLIDNGDILQGHPTTYYYNYIDTNSPHLCAEMMNYMGFSVGNMGNHDVEVGKQVFDRWIADCNFPVLGANIIDTKTDTPYLKPYEVIVRDGVKIAILGMISPAIPVWLPENLWEGLRFDDMEKTARKWIRIIQKAENPDLIIGLFHSGQYEKLLAGKYKDNASLSVARNIPGFDIVMMGHDHLRECKKIINVEGDTVLVVNPGNNGLAVAEVDVSLKLENGKVKKKYITGALISTDQYNPSEEFMEFFAPQFQTIEAFVSKKIGSFTQTITTRDAFFGPSPYIDFVHSIQLDVSKADISFTAPFEYNGRIKQGDVTVGDMFVLYKYENLLYTMKMTGKEIKDYLEYSYYLWTNKMSSPKDHLISLKKKSQRNTGFNPLKNISFNFDSAAGIIYTVDVTKKKGHKITIVSMADGTPFDLNKEYRVALNSHRGNGGGELLTKGAKIPYNDLSERIITSTDKDLRYYVIKHIENQGIINPASLNQWKFIPEEWAEEAAKRDREILFH